MAEDSQLLSRFAKERSESAFGELVTRHLPLVYSTALRQTAGDSHLAQDIAQLVFADLAVKRLPFLKKSFSRVGFIAQLSLPPSKSFAAKTAVVSANNTPLP